MRILVDMNLSPHWVPFLRAHGIEAVHWSAIGKASSPDSEIIEHAAASGFVIFTHDLGFGALLAATEARGPERNSGADSGHLAAVDWADDASRT